MKFTRVSLGWMLGSLALLLWAAFAIISPVAASDDAVTVPVDWDGTEFSVSQVDGHADADSAEQQSGTPLDASTSPSSSVLGVSVPVESLFLDFSRLPPHVYFAIALIVIGVVGFVNDVFLRL